MPSFQNITLDATNSVVAVDGKWRSNDLNGELFPTIFETDFSNDTGYSITNTGVITQINAPEGWDGAIATGNSTLEVLAAIGVGGSPAARLRYGTNVSQPTINLFKHLTGNQLTGYSELYIRYKVKFADNWKFGDGVAPFPYWKWGRLWQNTDPVSQSNWTENRDDSYYVVWNIAGGETYGIDFNISAAGNEEDGTSVERASGSAGGPHALLDYYITGNPLPHSDNPGYFNRAPQWDVDWTTNPGFFKTKAAEEAQDWHTVEFYVKCASSPGADDGDFRVYFDGQDQGTPPRISDKFSPETGPFSGLPTAANGSGFNMLVFFDNCSLLATDFDLAGVDGYIDVNDVVVAESRIGHDYVAGSVS